MNTIHYGNANRKRTNSPCGNPKHESDSTKPDKVNCIPCIESLLKRQTNILCNENEWAEKLNKLKKS